MDCFAVSHQSITQRHRWGNSEAFDFYIIMLYEVNEEPLICQTKSAILGSMTLRTGNNSSSNSLFADEDSNMATILKCSSVLV